MEESSNSLANTYLKLGYSKQEKGKYKDASEDYLRSIEIDPQNSKVHYLMALCLTELGLYEEAINSFGRATKLDDGKNTIYHLNLAIAKSKNKDLSQTLSVFIQNESNMDLLLDGVLSENKKLAMARLSLVIATQNVIRCGLEILGVSPLTKM